MAERELTRAMRKEGKLLKAETKLKNKAESKKVAKATNGKDQLLQKPVVPITLLEEYRHGERFRCRRGGRGRRSPLLLKDEHCRYRLLDKASR